MGKTWALLQPTKIANGLVEGLCEKRVVQNQGSFATEKHVDARGRKTPKEEEGFQGHFVDPCFLEIYDLQVEWPWL